MGIVSQCLAVWDVMGKGPGDKGLCTSPHVVPAMAASNPLCWPHGYLTLLGGTLGQDRLALLPRVGPF